MLKKLFGVLLCISISLNLVACNSNEAEKNNNNDDYDYNAIDYKTYNFGDTITVKVNDQTEITGNVIEDKKDAIVLLQDNNTTEMSSYDKISSVIEAKKTQWTNVKSLDILSFQVIVDNTELTDNHTMDGFNSSTDHNFLYATDMNNGYWVKSDVTNGANCYEQNGKCGWSIYNAYMELIESRYERKIRFVIEISKEYIK